MIRISKLLQSIPKFKGKIRLSKYLLKPYRNVRDIVIHTKQGILMKIPNIVEPVGYHLFINGEYETDEINFIKSQIRKNNYKSFIDIGANIGLFSLSVAKEFKNVSVSAFEASPRVFKYFDENIKLNDFSNITPFQLGLSNADNIEINFYSDETKFGTGSFAPVFTDKPEKVKCNQLDTLIKNATIPTNADLIKIDVEGFELQVFQGAKELLSKENTPLILFEFVDWAEHNAGNEKGAAQAFLMELNFNLFKLTGNKLTPIEKPMTTGFATIIARKG